MLQRKQIFSAAILLFCFVLQGSVSAKILFKDDFEAEALGAGPSNKWVYDPQGEIKDIAQIIKDPVEGDKCMSHYGVYIVGEKTWKDYIVEWDWMRMDLNRNDSVNFRYQDSGHFYHLSPRPGGEIILYRYDGVYTLLVQADWPQKAQIWYRFQLVVDGDKLAVKIKEKTDKTSFENMKPLLEANDKTYKEGRFATGFWGPIDDVIITDLAGAAVVRESHSLAVTWGVVKIQL